MVDVVYVTYRGANIVKANVMTYISFKMNSLFFHPGSLRLMGIGDMKALSVSRYRLSVFIDSDKIQPSSISTVDFDFNSAVYYFFKNRGIHPYECLIS